MTDKCREALEAALETRAIHVTISVPADWANRLDMQHILEREIRADRWSWNWPAPAPAVDERTNTGEFEPFFREDGTTFIDDLLKEDLAAASNGSPGGAPDVDSLRGLDTPTRVRFYEHDFYVLSNFSAWLQIRGKDGSGWGLVAMLLVINSCSQAS